MRTIRDGAGAARAWILGWAAVQGGFALGCALTGAGPRPLAWFVIAVVLLAGVAALTGVRALLMAAAVLSAVSAFSLLMDVVGLLFAQGVDSPPAAVLHALGLVGAVLLWTAASRGLRPGEGGPLPFSGVAVPRSRPCTVQPPCSAPPPSAASRRTHLAAYAGVSAFVPYVAMKMVWVLGGTFAGVSGADMHTAAARNGASGLWLTLARWGVDGTVLLAALGLFLLFGLIRPWGQVFPRWTPVLHGRRVPRWLPLTPALIGLGTLVPYGLFGIGYLLLAAAGLVTVRAGDFPSSADAVLVGWIGFTAFAGYGLALLAATRSYWLRSGSGSVRCGEVCGPPGPGRRSRSGGTGPRARTPHPR
ncbi:hypothetical protein [Streptomyces sp. NPDC048603]|uniref:hypothetical protein n=1 Tax=Streptomyces sp. NPDC048603 TaxID=3365577 RepID=UPI0037106466